jgi:hypothetical protein
MTNKFGNIIKRKAVNKVEIVERPVKSWRAKLAEWLLSKDIEYLEREIANQQRERFNQEVSSYANIMLSRFINEYKMQLDEEILEKLDIYELQFSADFKPIDDNESPIYHVTETREIPTRNGVICVPKRFVKKKEGSKLSVKLDKLAEEYNLPSITTWMQGRFIDNPRYDNIGSVAKSVHEQREKTLIRPGGGTNNALFRVTMTDYEEIIPKYLEEVGKILKEEGGKDNGTNDI